MSTDTFKQGLMELYQGELLGEVVFEQLLDSFPQPELQHKLATLLQLETETKARLRPVLMAHGLPLTEQDNARDKGLQMAQALKDLTWEQMMSTIAKDLVPVVERYRQIAAAAPEPYRQIADAMVVHEQSLVDFATLELSGDSARSLDGVEAQLQYTLPRR